MTGWFECGRLLDWNVVDWFTKLTKDWLTVGGGDGEAVKNMKTTTKSQIAS